MLTTITDGADSIVDAGTPALVLSGLRKSFRTTVAVHGVDLVVPQGSFFGLVGPNGAGKTTTLLMAVGLLRPDGGSARILRRDVWEDPVEARALVGVLPDGMAMPERLTGREMLTYLGLLRGIDAAVVAARTDELLDVLDLTEAEGTLVVDYSAGMRKKIGLAAAVLHGPRLLVLDEPFEGVDPASAAVIKTMLTRFVSGGGSVVFSSHVMAVVEQLCDRVALIADGRVLLSGDLASVRRGRSLEDVFVELVGVRLPDVGGLLWLSS